MHRQPSLVSDGESSETTLLSKVSRTTLQGGAASTACFLTLLISSAFAQGNAAWSPEPFQSSESIQPLNQQTRTAHAPSNSLRASSSTTNEQQVAVWRSANRQQNKVGVTATAAFRTDLPATQPQNTQARRIESSARYQPRESYVAQASTTQPTSPNGSQSTHVRSASNAVWIPQNRSSSNIRPAQFEIPAPGADPSIDQPVPQAQQLPTEPPSLGNVPEQITPPDTQNSQADGLRSLLESDGSDSNPPTPFLQNGNEEKLDNAASPSDETDESNRPPEPPRASAGRLQDCDAIRSELVNAQIHRISLDASPAFGVGPKSNVSREQKRQSFAKEAPIRSWYDFRGRLIVDGRLVDLRYDAIEIELADGSREAIFLRDLSDADHAYVAEAWWLPVTCGVSNEEAPQRNYVASTVTWRASGLCHKPLYFEEIQLERYGHEFGPVAQPIISTAHFFGNVALLPYKMGIHPPTECQYALGYYRPGNCAPWYVPPVPLSLRGAAAQATVVTGAAMVLP